MPIYEFSCPQGHVTERLASMDTEAIECPECGEEAPRRMSAPAGFDFRGPGFYATDYASRPSGAGEGAGKAKDGDGSGDSGGSSSEAASGSGSGSASSASDGGTAPPASG